MLAEAARELGGRVTIESRLPGLGEWARVRDYRVRRIEGMTNVEVYRESELDVDNVLEIGADHVAIATGAHWRSDGFGRFNRTALAGLPAGVVYTPDDIMAGRQLEGRVVVFDDDHYYMGAVVAERLLASGVSVGFVTPGDKIAAWAGYTNEQGRSQRRLIEAGCRHRHGPRSDRLRRRRSDTAMRVLWSAASNGSRRRCDGDGTAAQRYALP